VGFRGADRNAGLSSRRNESYAQIFNVAIYILLFLMGLKYTFALDIGVLLRTLA